MTHKTILITGASDGIGAAAAKQLVHDGHTVAIIGRNADKTKAIADSLSMPYYVADFTKLDDVETLANKLLEDFETIDVLVNNAGGIMGKRTVTDDGFEMTLQVNHLAPFLLTNLLLPKLTKNHARIITTSSVAHKLFAKFDINDLNLEHDYSVNRAYGNAKLANILFTTELNRRFKRFGVMSTAFHPGNVATSFAANSSSPLRFIYKTFLKRFFLISPEKGADTLLWLINAPETELESGAYYYKRKKIVITNQGNDPIISEQLWEASATMTGLVED